MRDLEHNKLADLNEDYGYIIKANDDNCFHEGLHMPTLHFDYYMIFYRETEFITSMVGAFHFFKN